MLQAIKEAEAAMEEGEEPVGTVIVDAGSGMLMARAHQQVRALCDPTAHALMIALTQLAAGESTEQTEQIAAREIQGKGPMAQEGIGSIDHRG